MQHTYYRNVKTGTSNTGTSRNLSQTHRRELAASGISQEVAAARGYRTVRRRSEIPHSFPDWQRRLGLLIPTYSPSGSVDYQLKPTRPIKRRNGHAPKYEQPHGSSLSLDVNPLMLREVREGSSDLWISEGSKKIDSLASRGEAALGIIGVWCYAVPKTHSQIPLEDWKNVRLEGRRVIIVYDADAKTNYSVQLALQRLVAMLEKLGAEVLVTYIPPVDGDGKAGVDDYLGAGGSLEELRQAARSFQPTDIVRERMSRDDRLRAGVEDLYSKLWDTPWSRMAGASDRDVYLKIVEQAERRGKLHPGGLRVRMAQGPLALAAKVSTRTVWKSLNRLEERGLLYRDNADRAEGESGAFVLLCNTAALPRAGVSHSGSKATRQRTVSAENVTDRLQPSNTPDLHLRAPVEIPRLRWSQPGYRPRRGLVKGSRRVRDSKRSEPRPAIKRLGKTRGHIIDALAAAGGTLALQELARILHKSRPRDLRRRNMPMLEECGIVVLSAAGDSVSLTENWLEALAQQRRIGKEIEAEELAERRYKIKSRAYHNRHKTPKSRPSAVSMASVRVSRDRRRAYLDEHAGDPTANTPSDDELVARRRRVEQLVREGMARRFAEAEVNGSARAYASSASEATRSDPPGDPPESEPERKLPPKENGIYRHPAHCDCWLCGDHQGVA
jgi:Domain of unknown function (DUF3854)